MDIRQVKITVGSSGLLSGHPEAQDTSTTDPWLLGEIFLGVRLLQLWQVTTTVALSLPSLQLGNLSTYLSDMRIRGIAHADGDRMLGIAK